MTTVAVPVGGHTDTRPVTVLHVFGVMDRGGAETRTLEVVRGLDPRQVHTLFCTLTGRLGTLAPEIQALGSEVLGCRLGPLFALRFLHLLRSRHPDVVHSHVATFSGAVLLLARLTRVPVRIVHFRSESDGHPSSPRRRAQRALMRWLIDRNATAIRGVSMSSLSLGWRPNWSTDPRCAVIYNGVDLARFRERVDTDALRAGLAVAGGQSLCLHVGRPGPEKNRHRALAVLAALRRQGRDAVLVMVGRQDPAEPEALRRRADELGVLPHLRLIGERDDVPDLLRAADLVLVPSRREGLPGVVLEACAASTPVLASDLAGVREIAAVLSGVATESLSSPDETWAQAAADLLERAPRPQGDALRELERSPFSLVAARKRLAEDWKGGR